MFEMACLRVPFEGNSIQELYKKINKGIIARIPKKYSKELSDMIKLCLTKDQKRRPSVSELLEHPVILTKMGTDMPVSEDVIPGELWQTIKLPKNLDMLIQRLPQKKYRSGKDRKGSKERRNSGRAMSVGNPADAPGSRSRDKRNFKKESKNSAVKGNPRPSNFKLYDDGDREANSKNQANLAPPSKVLPRRPSKKKLVSEKNPYNLARRPSSKNISNSYMSKYKSQKQIKKVYSKRDIAPNKQRVEYVKPPSYEMRRVPSGVRKKERPSSKDRRTSVENKLGSDRKASREKRASKEKRSSVGSRKESTEKKPVVTRKPKPIPKPSRTDNRQGPASAVQPPSPAEEPVEGPIKEEVRGATGGQGQAAAHPPAQEHPQERVERPPEADRQAEAAPEEEHAGLSPQGPGRGQARQVPRAAHTEQTTTGGQLPQPQKKPQGPARPEAPAEVPLPEPPAREGPPYEYPIEHQ